MLRRLQPGWGHPQGHWGQWDNPDPLPPCQAQGDSRSHTVCHREHPPGWMREPLQKCIQKSNLNLRLTCQGHLLSEASCPPTTPTGCWAGPGEKQEATSGPSVGPSGSELTWDSPDSRIPVACEGQGERQGGLKTIHKGPAYTRLARRDSASSGCGGGCSSSSRFSVWKQ